MARRVAITIFTVLLAALAPAAASAAVLYEQSMGGWALIDQDFETAVDAQDTFLADDFTNAEEWIVESIYIPGVLSGDGADLANAISLNWQIYYDDGGVPDGNPWSGGAAWSLSLPPDDPAVSIQTGGTVEVTVTLPASILVPAGTWWLVFYPEMDLGLNEHKYFWITSASTNGADAQTINPGGGWGYGTDWVAITDPSTYELDDPGMAFRLEGEVGDREPDAFSFTDQTGVALNSVIASAPITVTGINLPATISVEDGEYRINSGGWSSSPDFVDAGDEVRVRLTSANDYSAHYLATLTIGSQSDIFDVTTQAPGAGVLWHQPVSGPIQNAWICQDFDADNDYYDVYIADDLTTATGWNVTSIFVAGALWGGATDLANASTLNWALYADDSGKPAGNPRGGASPLWSLTLAPSDGSVTLSTSFSGQVIGDVTVSLSSPLVIQPGTYWFLFYVGQDLATGYWGLAESDTTHGSAAQVMSPEGGWSLPTTWTSVQDPSTMNLTRQDFAFRLDGVEHDLVPDQFTFVDIVNAPVSTLLTSNTVTITGINVASPISVTGGEYKINGGGYTAVAGTVQNNDEVTVRQTSSASFATQTDATLTVGSVSDTFSVTTTTQTDAGVPQQDAAVPQQDASTPQQDAGTPQQDSGTTPQQDSGTTPQQDSGTTPWDGGTSWPDGGSSASPDGGLLQPSVSEGCSCRATASGSRSLAGLLLLLVVPALVSRRRRGS